MINIRVELERRVDRPLEGRRAEDTKEAVVDAYDAIHAEPNDHETRQDIARREGRLKPRGQHGGHDEDHAEPRETARHGIEHGEGGIGLQLARDLSGDGVA